MHFYKTQIKILRRLRGHIPPHAIPSLTRPAAMLALNDASHIILLSKMNWILAQSISLSLSSTLTHTVSIADQMHEEGVAGVCRLALLQRRAASAAVG